MQLFQKKNNKSHLKIVLSSWTNQNCNYLDYKINEVANMNMKMMEKQKKIYLLKIAAKSFLFFFKGFSTNALSMSESIDSIE
ncbi:MAG: hypothetical protein CM15mP69_1600 [Ectothiorhodospiraceae bacterium]|nr:MAG: hypothetical protein CM15mP69_1600 [Ectothiorhodospiraceae bacterium]